MRSRGRFTANPRAFVLSVLAVCLLGGCGGAGPVRSGGSVAGDVKPPGTVRASQRLEGDSDEDGRSALVKERTKADAEGDSDNEGGDYYDWDDSNVLQYGHPAGIAEGQAIASVVERFYAAALRRDGAAVCGLTTARVANSVLSEFGQGKGPLALGGDSCAVVMSRLLARLKKLQFSVAGRPPRTGVVRVEGDSARVLLTYEGTRPSRFTVARRERGAWKVDELLDMVMP